jgi:hypothetical protein
MSVDEFDGPAGPQEFSDTDDWQLAVAPCDRRVGNPRCNKPDHGRSLDRQKRVRGIQMPDKNADGEFVDEILPSCSRTLPSIVCLWQPGLKKVKNVRPLSPPSDVPRRIGDGDDEERSRPKFD